MPAPETKVATSARPAPLSPNRVQRSVQVGSGWASFPHAPVSISTVAQRASSYQVLGKLQQAQADFAKAKTLKEAPSRQLDRAFPPSRTRRPRALAPGGPTSPLRRSRRPAPTTSNGSSWPRAREVLFRPRANMRQARCGWVWRPGIRRDIPVSERGLLLHTR